MTSDSVPECVLSYAAFFDCTKRSPKNKVQIPRSLFRMTFLVPFPILPLDLKCTFRI